MDVNTTVSIHWADISALVTLGTSCTAIRKLVKVSNFFKLFSLMLYWMQRPQFEQNIVIFHWNVIKTIPFLPLPLFRCMWWNYWSIEWYNNITLFPRRLSRVQRLHVGNCGTRTVSHHIEFYTFRFGRESFPSAGMWLWFIDRLFKIGR